MCKVVPYIFRPYPVDLFCEVQINPGAVAHFFSDFLRLIKILLMRTKQLHAFQLCCSFFVVRMYHGPSTGMCGNVKWHLHDLKNWNKKNVRKDLISEYLRAVFGNRGNTQALYCSFTLKIKEQTKQECIVFVCDCFVSFSLKLQYTYLFPVHCVSRLSLFLTDAVQLKSKTSITSPWLLSNECTTGPSMGLCVHNYN